MKTFDYIGINRYFLTICSRQRTRVFVDHDVALVLLQLARTADVDHIAVIAYCFMPDHLHALVEGTRVDSDFQRFVRVFKQRSSFEWKRRTGNALWQRSYFEHVLRDDEDLFGVARYILTLSTRSRSHTANATASSCRRLATITSSV